MTNKDIPEPPAHANAETRLVQWLDQRTGIDSLLHEALDEPIPGGASWAYIFGSGLVVPFCFAGHHRRFSWPCTTCHRRTMRTPLCLTS